MKINKYYPSTGPLRRELYDKHMQFFAAGSEHRQRCILAANRIGKTEGIGGYETTLHLTGIYPDWWTGRRFAKPINAVAAGTTAKTTREIIQEKLLGPIHDMGTGLIPHHLIGRTTPKAGIPDAIEMAEVEHSAGGFSRLYFKSYEQGRECFEGTERDLIWLDEEPPMEIYTECLMRTMTTDGLILCTFTPLKGLSDVVQMFIGDDGLPSDFKHNGAHE